MECSYSLNFSIASTFFNHIYEFDALTDEMAKDLSGGEYVTAEEYETYLRDQLITDRGDHVFDRLGNYYFYEGLSCGKSKGSSCLRLSNINRKNSRFC